MKLEVLLSCMNQNDISIVEKNKITTDVIVINQCNTTAEEYIQKGKQQILFVSRNERGIGMSRNTGLMKSRADICLFADDDVTYVDDYEKIICNEFERHPEAEMILFNLKFVNSKRKFATIKKFKKAHLRSSLRYGAVRIAVKPEVLHKNRIYFSLLFGGGAKYGAGEDSLFIRDCFKHGVKIYLSPQIIGEVDQKESTWFTGYNEKYFYDKGALWKALMGKFSELFYLQYLIRHSEEWKSSKMKIIDAFRLMKNGGDSL